MVLLLLLLLLVLLFLLGRSGVLQVHRVVDLGDALAVREELCRDELEERREEALDPAAPPTSGNKISGTSKSTPGTAPHRKETYCASESTFRVSDRRTLNGLLPKPVALSTVR